MIDKEEVLKVIEKLNIPIIMKDFEYNMANCLYKNILEEINKLPVYEDTELLKECYSILRETLKRMYYLRQTVDTTILDKLRERLGIE